MKLLQFAAPTAKAPSNTAANRSRLPVVNACVDVSLNGSAWSVPVEDVSGDRIEIRKLPGLAVGDSAMFDYATISGHYRFRAECERVSGNQAFFAVPPDIRTIETFGPVDHKLRFETVLNVQFRYAPDGVGFGNFNRARTKNVSIDGVALFIGRELKAGTQLEVKFDFDGKTIVVIGELTRPTHQESCDRHVAGLKFIGLDTTGQNIIGDFINRKLKGRRDHSIAV